MRDALLREWERGGALFSTSGPAGGIWIVPGKILDIVDACLRAGAFVGRKEERRRLAGLKRDALRAIAERHPEEEIAVALKTLWDAAQAFLREEGQRRQGTPRVAPTEKGVRGKIIAPRRAVRRAPRPRSRATRRARTVAVAASPGPGEDGSSSDPDSPPPHAPAWGLLSRTPRLIFPSIRTVGVVPGGPRCCWLVP